MYTIYVEKDEVIEDYPNLLEKWEKVITDSGKEINEDKLEFYYSYSFFVPKIDDTLSKQEMYNNMHYKCLDMLYPDRLVFELSKVRVNFTMKMGNFVISDRMVGDIPKSISDIVGELTKVKMLVESEQNDNEEVKKSIPEIDTSIVSVEIIDEDEDYDEDYDGIIFDIIPEPMEFDLDDILEKISKDGIDSLSKEEKDFLNKKSKDI